MIYLIFFCSGSCSEGHQISAPALQAAQGYAEHTPGQGEDQAGSDQDRVRPGADEQGREGDYLYERNLAPTCWEEGSYAERDE